MINERPTLQALLIEDDKESLDLLLGTLPRELEGFYLEWEGCDSFEKGRNLIQTKRYDLVLTDVYLGDPAREDAQGSGIVDQLKSLRFCPVLAVSYGSRPEGLKISAFVRFADKSNDEEINTELTALLQTRIPILARQLHDELDRASGSYLWGFLEDNWGQLLGAGLSDPAVLERLVRRRAAIQIGRLDPVADGPTELDNVEGVEFYIYPSVAGDALRLGEILRNKQDKTFCVVLTPHCHLVVQPSDVSPRADHVLIVKAFPAKDIITISHTDTEGNLKDPWPSGKKKKLDLLRRRVQSPAGELGKPRDRYWFLPNFLDIPAMYCDLLQLESLRHQTLLEEYERVAVLDTPFAEALQSCFTRFYSAVGVPPLKIESLEYLIE